VQAHDVGDPEDRVLRRGRPAAGIPRPDLHAEGAAQLGDAHPDLAGAEHAERLAEELREHLPRPGALAHLAVDPRDFPCRGEHERQGVLGDGEGVHPGRVAHGHATATGGVEVDVVRAGAPDRDELDVAAGGEHRVGEARVGSDVDDRARAVDAADQLGLVVGAARGVDARLADLL